ncbi:hypothetical protein BKA61DRAFT_586950 [Leptodontidium sp. MPI-SDFR-AT-0119]|nr:hypothetical protein BKA61DRAFT_586950 [Leptodontidium sp. MPI-SDFR-AT-0119]
MPKRVCRIRWHKGKPLGLIRYAAPTFLDLPRELRDRIYYHALVSPDPITVCSMEYDWMTTLKDGKISLVETVTLDTSNPTNMPPTLAMLSCNRQLATEAAVVFYGFNTFRFTGYETWQPMYEWLRMIGDKARAHLRNLMVEVQRPKGLIQDRHGSHEFHYHFQLPWQFMRVACSYDSGHDSRKGVDCLSPAADACFRILGKVGHDLTLRLVLPQGLLPGVEGWCMGWDSLALPDQIERLQREFTAGRVIVLWEGILGGVGIREKLLGKQAVIKAKGWEIVDIKEGLTQNNKQFQRPTTLFTIRRTLCTSPLILESSG